MELEQRVKSLELELKILKNEIYHVLVEVQQQVINAASDIGVEEAPRPVNRRQPREATRATQAEPESPNSAVEIITDEAGLG